MDKECFECELGFPLEYFPGYGWYHINVDGGPAIECVNPDVIDLPNPEDFEE